VLWLLLLCFLLFFYLFVVAVINGKQLQKIRKIKIKREPNKTAHPKVELQNEM